MSAAVKPGYVYFLHAVNSADSDGMERYKIGLTTRYVEDRLKELNSGQSPFWLVEKWSIQVSNCEAVESALHIHFASRRLYIDTSNGHTGNYADIDSSVRKSTEWFMFADHELSAVEESYQNIQNQYEWQMLPPNKKQHRSQQNQAAKADRRWQHATNTESHYQTGGNGDGWGCFATAIALFALIPCVQLMSNFANTVNSASSDVPIATAPKVVGKGRSANKPSDSGVNDAMQWVMNPFASTDRTCTVKSMANARDSNLFGPPIAVSGQTIGKGTQISVSGDGEWMEIRSGKWVGKQIHKSMCN